MKEMWKEESLGDFCTFQKGLTYSKSDEVEFSNNVVLRANNLSLISNKLDFSELRYINENIKIPSEKKLLKGSLIISTASGSKAHLGKVALIDQEYGYAFGGFMGQITPNASVCSKYLFYILTSPNFRNFIDKLADGVNINNLRFNQLEKFKFHLPPLPEQRRIVAILDEAFAAIAKAKENTEKNIQNTRDLLNSCINNVFNNTGNVTKQGWQLKTLGDFFDITSSKRVFKSEWKHDGVPFYRAREIVKLANQGFVNNKLYISNEMFTEYSTKYGAPKAGDIMVTGVGTLGVCYVVRPNDRFYFKDGNIIWLKKKSEVDSNFVEYAFRSEFLRKQIDNSIGVTVGTFTIIKAKNTHILLPPISVQKQLVTKLDALSAETQNLETIYKKKQADLEELKKSLLQKAFVGELTKV